ncbi:MAG: hypothetical protein HY644_09970 [Acidobacteria bacterium]|nr:hypothetical protein [Acidobacteriota bacterium]
MRRNTQSSGRALRCCAKTLILIVWQFSASLLSLPQEGTAALARNIARPPEQSKPVADALVSETPQEPLEARQGYRPLIAVLHVHSRFSNGEYQILELAAYAHQYRLDVLGITDSLLTRVRYGIGPWKKLFSRSVSREGVLDHGIDQYLASVRAAQQQFENVVLLPGLEVTPFYYWQGSLRNDLRLLNFDRHFLIFGLRDAQSIRQLPVIENETWANTPREWSALIGPAVALLVGVVLLLARREKVVRLTYFVVRKRQHFWVPAFLFLVIGGAWIYNDYPFGKLADPYSGKHDVEVYQQVVDYVRSHYGVSFWSYPEARYNDVVVGGVRMISGPHAEDLSLVDRYDGFEGLYGDRRTATEPGNVWDRVLLEYLRGERKSWPSVITGIDFHSFKGGGRDLRGGQTVLWARNKDEISVLDALRRGRGYAVFQRGERELTLRNFALQSAGKIALAGETLQTETSVQLTAVVDWNIPSQTGDSTVANVAVIRDGELVKRNDLQLPIRLDSTETLAPGKHYYRMQVRYRNYELLSNPVFVEAR